MCSCKKCHNHTTDICFYVPFCIVFVFLGIVQIISGIFYFITIPVVKLILNVAIGCWVSNRFNVSRTRVSKVHHKIREFYLRKLQLTQFSLIMLLKFHFCSCFCYAFRFVCCTVGDTMWNQRWYGSLCMSINTT